MIQGLDHINIRTAKLAETVAFFRDVLGLTEGWRPPFDFGGAWLYQGERAIVHLVERETPLLPSREACIDHIAFAIDDYEATRARLDAAGLTYREAPVPGSAIRQMFVQDPNGATIELNHKGG